MANKNSIGGESGGSTGTKTPTRRSWFDIMTDARKEDERNKHDITKDREHKGKQMKGRR